TSALLPVRLPAAAADLAPGLRLVGALPGCGQLSHDDLVHQRDVGRRVEDLVGQLSRPDRTFATHGAYVHSRHHSARPSFATAALANARPSRARLVLTRSLLALTEHRPSWPPSTW